VLRLVRDERVDQDEHFEFFTVAETPKIVEIRNFQNFDSISKNISKTTKVTKILQGIKYVQNNFFHPVDQVYTHLQPAKRDHN